MKQMDKKAFRIHAEEEDIKDWARITQHAIREIKEELPGHKQGIKQYITIDVEFKKYVDIPMVTEPPPTFRTTVQALQRSEYGGVEDHVVDEFFENGSGWIFTRFTKLHVKMFDYETIHDEKYLQLPTYIKYKQAVINVQNRDDKCFTWAILSAIHPQPKDPQRVAKYRPYLDELNCEGLTFPVKASDKKMIDKKMIDCPYHSCLFHHCYSEL